MTQVPFKVRFKCSDCDSIGSGPMLHNSLWLSIAKKEECLCFGCIEKRLGRVVQESDLRECPMNDALIYEMRRSRK